MNSDVIGKKQIMKDEIYTGGLPNGYWIDTVPAHIAKEYILGCADGLIANSSHKVISINNPKLTRENVVDTVLYYFSTAPGNKYRSIVATIRGGADEAC